MIPIFLFLAVLQIALAAPPPASICKLIATQVPELRNQNMLKAAGKVKLKAGEFTYDRFLGVNEAKVGQSSAVFLSADGKHVIKMYPGGPISGKGPQFEYWASKYLIEKGVEIPAMLGLPQVVRKSNLDQVTRDFLKSMNIKDANVIVVVKEHAVGLTEAELRKLTEIPPEQLPKLLEDREAFKKKIKRMFEGDEFDRWLRQQGPEATALADSDHNFPDNGNRNFVLTEKGWVLFDP